MTSRKSERPSEASLFLGQLVGLWPGRRVVTLDVHRSEPGDLNDWGEDDLKLLIAEGQRQLDRQVAELERIRARSQVLFTTNLAVGGLFAAVFVLAAKEPDMLSFVFLLLGFLLWLASSLVSLSVIVASREIGAIDATLLSRQPKGVTRQLATSYARTVKIGANTCATVLTVFRDAAMVAFLASILLGIAWIVAIV
jgi:hypothetical protein